MKRLSLRGTGGVSGGMGEPAQKVQKAQKAVEAGFEPNAATAPQPESELTVRSGPVILRDADDDGAAPCSWAEGVARLRPDQPPSDVPLKRWQQFIGDLGRFLDGPLCSAAVALGWVPHDLFGCDRDRPFASIDQVGLLWLLNGDRLVALSENTATIEKRTGAKQTYRRKPAEPGRVLAWELT